MGTDTFSYDGVTVTEKKGSPMDIFLQFMVVILVVGAVVWTFTSIAKGIKSLLKG